MKKLMKKTPRAASTSNLLFEIDEWTYQPSSSVTPVTFEIWDFSEKVCITQNPTDTYVYNYKSLYHFRNLIMVIIIGFIQNEPFTLWCSIYKMAKLVHKN